eukprot:TRINITY_DN2191_c0_g3_i1.p1 TRINITY_DN2191_c0_g3~~TRINITY_DN2191_c0_g3_i1.p1  ORF type:complete len:209 (-),score=58.99 TRINITY_DN2191_c0_g3_i1:133-759(-)
MAFRFLYYNLFKRKKNIQGRQLSAIQFNTAPEEVKFTANQVLHNNSTENFDITNAFLSSPSNNDFNAMPLYIAVRIMDLHPDELNVPSIAQRYNTMIKPYKVDSLNANFFLLAKIQIARDISMLHVMSKSPLVEEMRQELRRELKKKKVILRRDKNKPIVDTYDDDDDDFYADIGNEVQPESEPKANENSNNKDNQNNEDNQNNKKEN